MRCLDCFSLSVARFSAQARYTNQLRLTPAIAKAAADILATVQKLGVAEGCDLCAYWAQCWLTCLFIVVLLADDADSIPAAAAAVHSLLATAPIAIATWSRWQIAPAVSIRARLSTVCSIFTVLANCSSPAMQPGHAWKYAAPALTRALLATRLAGDFLLRFCSGQSACRQRWQITPLHFTPCSKKPSTIAGAVLYLAWNAVMTATPKDKRPKTFGDGKSEPFDCEYRPHEL